MSTPHANAPPFVASPGSPITSKRQKPTLTCLIVSQRPESQSMPVAVSSRTLSPEESASVAVDTHYHNPIESSSSVSSGNPIPMVSIDHYNPPQQPSAPAVLSDTISSAVPEITALQSQAPSSPVVSESQADSHVSRIALPDEASRYIVNPVGSPVPSPRHDATFVTSTVGPKPRVSSNLVPQRRRMGEFSYPGSEGDGGDDEVKEDSERDEDGNLLYDEDEDETDLGSVQEQTKLFEFGRLNSFILTNSNSSTTAPLVSDHQSLSGLSSHNSPSSDLRRQIQIPETSSYSQMQQKSTLKEGLVGIVGVDSGGQVSPGIRSHQSSLINKDSTLSPSSQHPSARLQSHMQPQMQPQMQLFQHQQQYPQAQQRGVVPILAQTPPGGEFSLSNPADVSSSTISSFTDIHILQQRDPQYRALPLLSSDLPTTFIQVSQSLVRPNDRGKEVLSFVIIVHPDPVNPTKESWKVEKMYSDVVALDARVRGTVGKAIAKKIVSLPEGKLWKDHAPAKVDHRKVCLSCFSS